MKLKRTLFLLFYVFLLIGWEASLAAPFNPTNCQSLLAAAPKLGHVPSFDTLLVGGYRVVRGQAITFNGSTTDLKTPFKSIRIGGVTASIVSWTIPTQVEQRQVGLRFETDPNSIHGLPIAEVLKSPEITATFDMDRVSLSERLHESIDYIWIDHFKDPKSLGFINRARVSDYIVNYRDADFSAGYVMYKFAKNFELAKKLGFEVDVERNIIYYPDESSFNDRLNRVYGEWGIKNGVGSKEVDGLLKGLDWVRLITRENKIGRSGSSDYETHWHDLDSHTLGWIATVDAIRILRQRLIFLDTAHELVNQWKSKEGFADLAKLLEKIEFLMVTVEGYNNLEIGLPDGRVVAGLLDQDLEKRSLWISRIKSSILRVGGQSAEEVKKALMTYQMPHSLQIILNQIPASSQKIDSNNIDSVMEQVIKRIR